ncbi:MAG: sensor histidine kinase [Clostridia bacterium]|nr:sensor histidine kinase [Clostridia bacterium]
MMREISLHILDIAQNSITANASLVEITVDENEKADTLSVIIADNGKGMSEEMVKNVVDPFTTGRTTRKVGLGIPLIKMAAENTGGSFKLESKLGVGTTLTAVFVLSSIDRQPLGDMAETMLGMVTSYENVDFLYVHKVDGNEFILDTREIKKILGGVSLSEPDVYMWLSEYLKEGEYELTNKEV